jgi:hypothetical protein
MSIPPRRPSPARRRVLTAAFSLAGHGLALFVLLSAQPAPPTAPEPEPMSVALVAPPPPPEPPPPPPPVPDRPAAKTPVVAKPAPAKPPPRRRLARRAPPSPTVAPLIAASSPTADGPADVSDAEIASAGTAGSGNGSGRGCDMARRLQAALRRDPRVQAAVAEAHRGKAIRIWNGDWLRHGEQEGAGLAAVREAIMWEVGFAPEACRTEPVHGLILISLGDNPGSARLVVGRGAWRWSDVLFAQGVRR